MNKPPAPAIENDALSGTLCRHLVPIQVSATVDGMTRSEIFTAFLLQVGEFGFLVTAGHVAHIFRRYFSDNRISDLRFNLLDGNSPGSIDKHPVPFSHDSIRKMRFVDEDGYDYGVISIEQHYWDLMLKNGCVPLSEEFWGQEKPEPEDYAVVGVPVEWDITKPESKKVEFFFCVKIFKRFPTKPADVSEDLGPYPIDTIFGDLVMDESLVNIKGMSGGPVFGLKKNAEGKLGEYFLMGVQSSWIDNRILVASPIGELVKDLQSQIEEQARKKIG